MDTEKKDTLIKAHYKPLMFFNTTLRNVGLYTSIAFAGLAFASRQHDRKNRTAFLFGLLLVLLFLLVAASLNYYLYFAMIDTMKKTHEPVSAVNPLVYVSILLVPVHAIMISFTLLKLVNVVR